MRRIRKYIELFLLVSLTIIWLSGCEKELNINVVKNESHYVVDGLITTDPGPYTIRITKTGEYNQGPDGTIIPVEGARVSISDDLGYNETLIEIYNGNYITTFLQGMAGRTYTLRIEVNGDTLLSFPEFLTPVAEIDSIYYELKPETKEMVTGHEVSIVTNDPANERNYYRWYWEGKYVFTTEFDGPGSTTCWRIEFDIDKITVNSDKFINGNELHQPVARIPFFSTAKYHVAIIQQSLSQSAYEFWKLVSEQKNRVGSVFDPPPARIRGNIINLNNPDDDVLGYFGASDFKSSSIVMKPKGIPPKELIRTYPRNINCSRLPNSKLWDPDRSTWPEGWE